MKTTDPNFDSALQSSGKRIDWGELYSEIVSLTSDNDKIIKDISPEEQDSQGDPSQAQQEQPEIKPIVPYKEAPEDIKRQMEIVDGYEPSQMTSPTQQQLDQKSTDQALNADSQAHGQMMSEAQHVQSAEQAKQEAQQPDQGQKAKKPAAKTAPQQPQADQESVNLQAVMEHYGIDEPTAKAMLEAERQGYEPHEILDALKRHAGVTNG
jgi:hypothetical protein